MTTRWMAMGATMMAIMGALWAANTTAKHPAAKPTTRKTTAPKPSKARAKPQAKKEIPAVLSFTMNNLAGQPVDLARYQGRVLLIVNTASKCGFTPQYAGLEKLNAQYAKQGLAILGFPANDFAGQEPGSNTEIGEFCRKNYGVSFAMFAKIAVKGDAQAPLYKFLTSADTNPASPGEVQWNFEKFLVGRDGQIKARFRSGVDPQSPEITQAVAAELAKPAP